MNNQTTAAALRLTRNWIRFLCPCILLQCVFLLCLHCACKIFPNQHQKISYILLKPSEFYGAYVPLSNLPHFLFRFSNIVRECENGFGSSTSVLIRRNVFKYILGFPVPRVERFSRPFGVIRSLLSHLQNLKAQRLAKNKVMELGLQRLRESAATQMWDFSLLVHWNIYILLFLTVTALKLRV